ncbi:hypothetical protein K490DRAFT_61860 [Saccharata proteae CBS 121410]|uniref:Uncharacterized protein n=1 Tax=Saccharata proteae CBS 121410 TaxID=1314787 RepID=A0A9P4I286_9PEZI|nr:hypothetical protein K490DRAFT_61860 [Saccharata proteae CBS 121410]
MSYKLSTSGLVLPSEASHLWQSDTSFSSDKTIDATTQDSDFDRKNRIRIVAGALLGYLNEEVLEDLSGSGIKRGTKAFDTVQCRLECAIRSTTDSFDNHELDGHSTPFWHCWEFLVKGNDDEVFAAQRDWYTFMAREIIEAVPTSTQTLPSDRKFDAPVAAPGPEIHTSSIELIIKDAPAPVDDTNEPPRLTSRQMTKLPATHSELGWAAERFLRGITTGDYMVNDRHAEETVKNQLAFVVNATNDDAWKNAEPGWKLNFMYCHRWIRELPYEKILLRLGMRERTNAELLRSPYGPFESCDDTDPDSE